MSGAAAEPWVFFVDDDPAIVSALSRGLAAEGFAVRSWNDARTFLNEHDPSRPGCLVADVAMPGLSGLELQNELVSRGCTRPIVFISGHGSIPMTVQAMRAGAVTFLPKPVRLADLIKAVREAVTRDAALRKDTERRVQVALRLNALTPREREVLALVLAGRMNKQIAAALGTAEKTIKVHRGRIMEKLQVRSLAELVLMTARWRTVARATPQGERMMHERSGAEADAHAPCPESPQLEGGPDRHQRGAPCPVPR